MSMFCIHFVLCFLVIIVTLAWIRSLGSVVTQYRPFNDSLLSFLELGFEAVMPVDVACVIEDAMVAFAFFV